MFTLTGLNVIGYLAFTVSMLRGLELPRLSRLPSVPRQEKEAGSIPPPESFAAG
jgi:hypothetical protein